MVNKDKTRTPIDRILGELDHAMRTCFANPGTECRNNPADGAAESALSAEDRHLSEGLMRINHSGEIAAQALYRGQSIVATNPEQQEKLLTAANEEQNHLNWCAQRLKELDGQPSKLAAGWYFGSFVIGVAAGLAGDRWSLGFVEETENQVSAHLDDHLNRLPAQDLRSRAIVSQMREDEARHAEAARSAGAVKLPEAVRTGMARIADVMRYISFRL